MTAQYKMILSVLNREQRGETFREAEFKSWAKEIQYLKGVNCEFKHAFRIYCQDIISCSSHELIYVLGGLTSVTHNGLHSVKVDCIAEAEAPSSQRAPALQTSYSRAAYFMPPRIRWSCDGAGDLRCSTTDWTDCLLPLMLWWLVHHGRA